MAIGEGLTFTMGSFPNVPMSTNGETVYADDSVFLASLAGTSIDPRPNPGLGYKGSIPPDTLSTTDISINDDNYAVAICKWGSDDNYYAITDDGFGGEDDGQSLLRSSDGVSWTQVAFLGVNQLGNDPFGYDWKGIIELHSGQLAIFGDGGLAITTDGTTFFKAIDSDLNGSLDVNQNSVATSPTTSLASTAGGILITTDGVTWSSTPTPTNGYTFSDASARRLNPVVFDGTNFVTVDSGGRTLKISQDGGTVTAGQTLTGQIGSTIAFLDAMVDGRVFLTCKDGEIGDNGDYKIFGSDDSGMTWSDTGGRLQSFVAYTYSSGTELYVVIDPWNDGAGGDTYYEYTSGLASAIPTTFVQGSDFWTLEQDVRLTYIPDN